mgnify:CR=1 FL=1
MSFHARLIELLKKDRRFIDDDGELIIAAVQDGAWKIDRDLIKLLLSDVEIRAKFFDEIDGYWVFNFNTFIEYTSQKGLLNNSYTRFRNRIGLTIGEQFLRERGDVALVWPYKDCFLEGGQTSEEDKHDEVFFNEVLAQDEITQMLAPKVLTRFQRYSPNGAQSVTNFRRDENGVIRDNLIIKGNNLLTLHSIKSEFRGQVNLIYIDPPFNTSGAANVFSYNNSFNHSSWLTFMKNRLEIARELLSQTGIIVIAIDHSELFYLGVLADEIFSRENRIGVIAVETNPRGRSDSKFFATSSEYFLVYAKDEKVASINPLPLTKDQAAAFSNKDDISEYRLLPFRRSGSNSTPKERPNLYYPIFVNEDLSYIGLEDKKGCRKITPKDTDGNDKVWRQSKERFMEAVANGDIVIKTINGDFAVYLKDRIKNGRKPKTIWVSPSYDASSHGTMLLKAMFKRKAFSYPKSIFLIKDIIRITTSNNDLILDFFAGSGTTAHAVLELNKEENTSRQFIICEQMDYLQPVTMKRISNVIEENKQGEFIYFELLEQNEAFMQKIQSAASSAELLNLWNDMAEGSFLNWYVNPMRPEDAILDFEALGREENGLEKQKHLLAEMLDKNQLYVNLSEIDDAQFNVSEDDKNLNRAFYGESING